MTPSPRGLLFGLTLFVSAGLVFSVQPMVARRVLPALGGSPFVWTTCVLFFQVTLVFGYALAHGIAKLRRGWWQVLAIGGLLAAAMASLPLVLNPADLDGLAKQPAPVLGLLGILTRWVGFPCLALSATAPLLQHWFSRGERETDSAPDPYRLYAASNAGSLLALMAYPLWVERTFSTPRQFQLWGQGVFGLAGLVALCARVNGWRWTGSIEVPPSQGEPGATWKNRLAWGTLALVPSVLMLGVTAHLTTDLAAVPLLWVVPLGLYLVSMILAFAGRSEGRGDRSARLLPVLVVLTAVVLGVGLVQLYWLPLHLLTLFVAAYVAHCDLAARRPATSSLTSYYLAIAVGGALGGAFCALIAPRLFDRRVEYPLALLASCLVLVFRKGAIGAEPLVGRALALPATVGITTALLVANVGGLAESLLGVALTVVACGLALLAFRSPGRRPLRFGLTVGALLGASGLASGVNGRILFRERNAFGVLTVTEAVDSNDHRLFHGSTLHGQQSLDPDRRMVPLTYFTRSGPIGQVFGAFRGKAPLRVGVTGVGVGTLAAYAEPEDEWTFYEIDPAVIRLATDPRFFTYLGNSRALKLSIKPGDARLSVVAEPDGHFDLLILDAFNSDAIPVHLLTREAVALYRRKLKPGGRLVFNLSNRYLDLAAVIAGLAADAGWSATVRVDAVVTPAEAAEGKRGSIWGVMAASEAGLGGLTEEPGWRTPTPRRGTRVWTDDETPLFGFIRLGGPPT